MNKKYLIIATLCLVSIGCRTRSFSNYGYNTAGYYPSTTSTYYPTTYANYNTAAGGVQGAAVYNPYYYTNSYAYPYYSPYYSSPYVYNPYSPYYSPYYRNNFRWGHRSCELNLSYETSSGSDQRSLSGENLRAEVLDNRTEVEYGNENHEKVNFFADASGKTFASGKLLVDDQWVRIDPKTQKCTSTRTQLDNDPENQIATFECSDNTIKISAEVLIPNRGL